MYGRGYPMPYSSGCSMPRPGYAYGYGRPMSQPYYTYGYGAPMGRPCYPSGYGSGYPRPGYAYSYGPGSGLGAVNYRVGYSYRYDAPRINYAATRSNQIGGFQLVRGPGQPVRHGGNPAGHTQPTIRIVSYR
jgi:hypothetical protein